MFKDSKTQRLYIKKRYSSQIRNITYTISCRIDIGEFIMKLKKQNIILEDFKDFEVINMSGADCEEDSPPDKLSDIKE
jgi:hypothetical protein